VSEFRFADPHWVHLLWAVLAFALALFLLERRGSDALDRLVSPALRARLVRAPAGWRRAARIALLALAGSCLVLALMRPQWGLRQVATPQVGAELMIALDVSRSMLAEDAVPNRLERAKAEIVDLLGFLGGDQVGLIAFAGRASVLCPLTPDFGFLRLVLESAGPGSVTRGGTRLEEPIRKAVAGFGPPSGASRAILLITDGEDHDSFALDAAKAAAEEGVTIIAIGFGDESGSEVYATDPRTGARELLRDAEGRPVRSRLDGGLLREIALETGGAYVPAGTGVLDLESIYEAHISGLFRGDLDERGRTVRDEAYGWFVLAALVFLVASVGVAAGPAVVAVLAFAIVLVPAPAVRAQSSEPDRTPVADALEAAEAEPQDEASASTPRERFNAGVAALEAGDLTAAERHLTRGRGDAGDDAELRYRASYDLGYLLFQRAGRVEAERPQDALADLYRAADYFREAITIRPEEEGARINLEVSLNRALLLADRLARERAGGLEEELAALAGRQRKVASEVVRLHTLSAADTSPDAGERLREEYRAAATSERLLLSDADTLAMRSGEEQSALEAMDEGEITPEDASRRAQLGGVLHYLHRARERMGQTRRQLRERQGERAYRRASAALWELERAIDQLRDPVRVLDRLLREEGELAQQTGLLLADERGLLASDAAAPRPVWLSREGSAESQASLTERVVELALRLRSGLEAGPPEAADPQQVMLFEAAGEALPFVEGAKEHLRGAFTALDGGVLEQALQSQQSGLEALAAARERFLDLKGLIEAAFVEEARIVALLHEAERDVLVETLEPLRAAQQRNVERGARIAQHLERERESALASAQGQDPVEENPALERVELAEQLLPLAVAAMRDATASLGEAGTPADQARFPDAGAAASDALERIEVLRRLFFSIVERVREVAEKQQALQDETRDAEAAAASAGDDPPDITPLGARQRTLAEYALALADGLALQANEAAAADDPAAAEGADKMRLAAEHILAAEGAMREGERELGLDPTGFEPARERQGEALEELGKALALLQPPQQPQQEQGEGGEQEPQQGEGEQQAKEQARQQEQAADPGQLLQGVRDREAKRRRDRARRDAGPENTVEKDW
jgi:Ca-activated chloride channel family protein